MYKILFLHLPVSIYTKYYFMTKIYLLFGLLLSWGALFAQNSPPGWLNSAGGFVSSEHASLTFVVGGVLGQTLECDGFHLQREIFIAETPTLPTQVEESITSDPLVFYPNPVQDVLRLRSEKLMQGTLYLYDTHGNTVLYQPSVDLREPVNLSHLSPGIYQLKFYPENSQETYTYKLLKQ